MPPMQVRRGRGKGVVPVAWAQGSLWARQQRRRERVKRGLPVAWTQRCGRRRVKRGCPVAKLQGREKVVKRGFPVAKYLSLRAQGLALQFRAAGAHLMCSRWAGLARVGQCVLYDFIVCGCILRCKVEP